MSRLSPYIGIAGALIVGMFFAFFIKGLSGIGNVIATDSTTQATATSTLTVMPNPAQSKSAVENPSMQATSTPVSAAVPTKTAAQEKKKVATVPTKATTVTPSKSLNIVMQQPVVTQVPVVTVPVSSGDVSLNAAADTLRGALVNILCQVPASSTLHSVSGSGVFIDPKGIILTNAHIAQYLLLADRGVSCTIRSGSPAVDKYKAALIYISPSWIHANQKVLTEATPIGTGEYDFALLAVTGSTAADPLPAPFPSIRLAQLPPATGTPVVIASYGAQFLSSTQVIAALSPTIVFGSVKDIFTFDVNSIDVLALGGSAAAQEGSSGGGVTDSSGMLVGTITTSTITGSTSTRSLDAITASYIRSEFFREIGFSLDVLLDTPIASSVADFAQNIPALESIVMSSVPQ